LEEPVSPPRECADSARWAQFGVAFSHWGILRWAASFGQGTAPATRVFGAYSVNADSVTNLPVTIIVDQALSPFLSLGSGPSGFEASIERRCADTSA
jgi:hypothetical protein